MAQKGLGARILDPAAQAAFIRAGKAVFTLCSVASGQRFTYRVTKSKPTPQYPEVCYFVKILTGGEGHDRWAYIGRIDHTGAFRSPPGRHEHAKAVLAFGWSWRHLGHAAMEFWHEGQCGKCGQPLTVPESIARGLGPNCSGLGYAKTPRRKKVKEPMVCEAAEPDSWLPLGTEAARVVEAAYELGTLDGSTIRRFGINSAEATTTSPTVYA